MERNAKRHTAKFTTITSRMLLAGCVSFPAAWAQEATTNQAGVNAAAISPAEIDDRAPPIPPPEPVVEVAEVKPVEVAEVEATPAVASARALSLAFRESAAKALPSVVTIMTRAKSEDADSQDAIRSKLETIQNFDSVGSGVIISSDGLVLTNHHVVADAELVEIRLTDGRTFKAQETLSDPRSDLAIVRIPGTDLPTAELGDSDQLYVGDWVLAIGSPFTLSSSVSAGIVSGTNRFNTLSKEVSGTFLQTDAAINPGNSGGPLIDLDGRVVGISTAISSRNGGFQGIGFAIPIARAKWIMKELQEFGRVRRARAGLGINDVPYSIANKLDLPHGIGAYVTTLTPGRPAAKAGLQLGDVILEFGGRRILSARELAEQIQQAAIGSPTPLTISRAGEERELVIELEERQ